MVASGLENRRRSHSTQFDSVARRWGWAERLTATVLYTVGAGSTPVSPTVQVSHIDK